MAWIYQALEIVDRRNNPLGKFRVGRWQDVQPIEVMGLCNHVHDTPEEALECPVVQAVLNHEFRVHIAPSPGAKPQ